MKWVRDNSLTLALMMFFLGSVLGQVFFGYAAENRERLQEGHPAISLLPYLKSGAFLSALFEN
jgi:hypothetical protein